MIKWSSSYESGQPTSFFNLQVSPQSRPEMRLCSYLTVTTPLLKCKRQLISVNLHFRLMPYRSSDISVEMSKRSSDADWFHTLNEQVRVFVCESNRRLVFQMVGFLFAQCTASLLRWRSVEMWFSKWYVSNLFVCLSTKLAHRNVWASQVNGIFFDRVFACIPTCLICWFFSRILLHYLTKRMFNRNCFSLATQPQQYCNPYPQITHSHRIRK